jgi:membrane-associated phospholipid phosphatase
MKLLPIIILLLFFSNKTEAQSDTLKVIDSTSVVNHEFHTKWYQSHYTRESIIPLSLALGGAAIIGIPGLKVSLQKKLSWNWNQADQSHYINLSLDGLQHDFLLEDEIRYAPAVAAYALGLCGLKSKHRFIDRSVILAFSYIASDFVVNNGKKLTKSLRPGRTSSSTDSYSLPSQHTAMAFVAAAFLDHELGYISPWISVGGYAAASWVGIARIANNDHWTSDVLVGAGVGILMTNATYWAYDGVMKLFPKKLTISPILNPQQTGMYFCYKF